MTMKFSQFPKKATTAQNFEVAGLQDGQNALLDLTALDNKADSGIEQAGVALSTANQAQLDAAEALDLIAQGGVGGGNALVNSTPTIEGSTAQYIRAMRIEYPLNAYGGGLMYMQFGEARAQLVFTYNASGAIEFRLELVQGVSSTGLPFKGGVLISEIQPGQWDVFFKRASGNSAVKVACWSDIAGQTSGITVEHFAEAWTVTAPMGVSTVDVYSWVGDDGRLYIDKDIILPQLETDKLTYIDSNGRLKASNLTKAVSEGLDGRLTTAEGKVAALETNSATKTELNNGLAAKEPKITAGVAGQFYAHDKTWKTPPQPDLSGYATTTALSSGLAAKEPKIPTGTSNQYIAGNKTLKDFPVIPSIAGLATTTELNNGLATKESKITADGSSTSFWNGLKNWVKVKLSDLTGGANDRVLVTNSSGTVTNSTTTRQELECLQGVTENVQAQLDNRLKTSDQNEWQAHYAQGSDPYIRYAKVTTPTNGSWNEYHQQFQIAVGKAFFGNQRYLNGTFLVELGTKNANESLDPKIMFYGHRSSNEQLFYKTIATSGGVINGIEIWGYSSGSTGTNCIVNVSVVHQRAQYSSYDLTKSTSVTAPSDLVEIPYMLMQGTRLYTSGSATIGGDLSTQSITATDGLTISNLSSNAGYIPTLDASGKLIKGASNGTSVVAGELQLHDLSNHTRVPYIDANKRVKLSNVTPTELNHLSGVTSNVQAQLDNVPKMEFANFCRIESHGSGANRWYKLFEYPKATTADGKMFFDVHFWNSSNRSGLLIIDGAFDSSTNVFASNARVSYLGINGIYDPSKLALCYNPSTGNIEFYANYATSLDRIVLSPRAIVEGVKGLTYFKQSNYINGLSAFSPKIFGTQMDLAAGAITTTDPEKVSSFAGGISLPSAQFNLGGAPSEYAAIGPNIKLSQRNHGNDKELYVTGGGMRANYLKFGNHTKLSGSDSSNHIYHSGFQHGGGRYTITSGEENSGSPMVRLDGGHNPSPSTFGNILLGNGDGSHLFRMEPNVGMQGPKVHFHYSSDGGVTWNLLGSIG